uniref:DUF4277 domain-containing protein n=1 Tax=Halomicronema hongdechloris TaxID=1209493 RepID=UPI0010CC5142
MSIQVQDLNHLGIVSGIIDEMGLVEAIDRQSCLMTKRDVLLKDSPPHTTAIISRPRWCPFHRRSQPSAPCHW